MNISPKAQHYIEMEERYGAHNYHPLPVVLSRGEGIYVWDVDGKRYYGYATRRKGSASPRGLSTTTVSARTSRWQHAFSDMTSCCP